MDSNQVPCCTYVPRQISNDELLRLLPSSWVIAYEQQVSAAQPQVLPAPVQSTNPEYITHPGGEVEIHFPAPRPRPSPFPTSFGMIQEKIPIKSFDSKGDPIYFFQDPVTGHKYFDLYDSFALIGQKEKHLRYLEAQLHQMQQQQPRAPSFASSHRQQQPLPVTVPSFIPQDPFALYASPTPPVVSFSRTFPTEELKELQRQQCALPKRTRVARGRARSRLPPAWTSTTALMDLSDYEDEYADALPEPPPFTPYPMPVSYPAPAPPNPLATTTSTPVTTTPPKSIHTIISPSENPLSEYLTTLSISDPAPPPSFMNEGPQPAALHVSEMDDDPEIQNPDTPRNPPVPPTPFTPYQTRTPNNFSPWMIFPFPNGHLESLIFMHGLMQNYFMKELHLSLSCPNLFQDSKASLGNDI
ncbi:extensin-2-like [Macadamia integrifolia]|uniref:extensin-2-like n=1 Tax=Macadamia integrifolia TaxID=60698 RepID=UPI001C4F8FB2|nr:extensin-2-like [Macadamia integrifolia]